MKAGWQAERAGKLAARRRMRHPCVATSTCKGQAVWAMTRMTHGEHLDD